MTLNEMLNEFPYGIVVLKSDDTMIHGVGYEQMPTQEDIDHLREELKTDKELGLTEETDYELYPVGGDLWVKVMHQYWSETEWAS